MKRNWNRRRTLTAFATIGIVPAAGCLGGDEGDSSGNGNESGNGGNGDDGNGGNGEDGNGDGGNSDNGNGSGDGNGDDGNGDDGNGDDGNGDDGNGDDGNGNDERVDLTGQESVEVAVGPDEEGVFDPEGFIIDAGTTVTWTWESDGHNVNPTSVPEDADWEGVSDLEDTGFEYEHVFEVPGTYEYQCDPHAEFGMVGEFEVRE